MIKLNRDILTFVVKLDMYLLALDVIDIRSLITIITNIVTPIS